LWAVVAAGLFTGLACATIKRLAPAAPPSSGVLFSHATHVDQEVECLTCHAGVDKATKSGKRHSPAKATCEDCHETKDQKQCIKCHRDPMKATGLARAPSTARLRFSHASHRKRARDCVTCHATAAVATSLKKMPRPGHQDCLSCHAHKEQYRRALCKKCHVSLARYPIKAVSAFNHQGNFLREHRRWARANADACATCHRQSYCADCHSSRARVTPSVKMAERGDRAFIHRGDWRSRHAMESRANPGQCVRCHSPKSCARCHRRNGITATATGKRSPHGAGWLSPASPNSHGREARRRITQCAACHDQGALSNCVRCHKSATRGGLGLRPHPPGWSRSGKRTNKMCLYCH